MKKLFSILFAVAFVVSMTANVYATSSNLYSDPLITKAIKMGIPTLTAQSLDRDTLQEITEDGGTVVSLVETDYSYDDSSKQRTDPVAIKTTDLLKDRSRVIEPKSTIDPSDLSVVAAVVRISERTGDNFKFTNVSTWSHSPTWELVDCIAMAWSDNFTLYADSCKYKYYNTVTHVWETKTCPRNDVEAEKGVAHDVDLLTYGTSHKITETAKVYKTNSTGTANLVARYAHEKITLSGISVGFSSSPSITFSLTVGLLDVASPAYVGFSY